MRTRPSGETATRFARRHILQWPLWRLPRWLQVMVAAVITAYCAAIATAAVVTPVQAGQLRLFALLLGCGAVTVEVTRRTGEPAGVVRDVYALWDLPTAVLLPRCTRCWHPSRGWP